MSLVASDLALRNFRNIESRDIELSPSTTILLGDNATGKTNTIEALQLLTTGFSFRHPTTAALVREGAGKGHAALRVLGDGRVVDLEVELDERGRHFSRNGKRCRVSDISGALVSILFTPDDLALVKRNASLRRDEIDSFGCQASDGYQRILSSFTRSIEQRNRLLKEERIDEALLDAWDESVSLGAASLLFNRLRLFSRLSENLRRTSSQFFPREKVECRYLTALGDGCRSMSKEQLGFLVRERMAASRADDIRRQQTLVGPHHDDIRFFIDGRDARDFGSQGQQRSLVLAWKLAEVSMAEEVKGSKPLLLLDDVMSELDEERRGAILRCMQEGIQTVISTTNLGYFSKQQLVDTKVVSYGS